MLNNKIYVNSIGIMITLTCRDNHYNLINFQTTDQAYICVQKPNKTIVEWPAIINIAKSTVSYTIQNNDFNIPGDYLYQIKLISQNGNIFYSETQKLTVYKQFE